MKPYYEHAGITIYHGDCRETLPSLSDGVDLLLSDPPYGIRLNNDWQNEVHARRGSASNVASGGIIGDEDASEYADLLRPFLRRVVFGFPYIRDDSATGWLVWDKEPGFKGRSLTSPIEMAYSTTWAGFKAVRLLWSGYMRAPRSEAKWGHPTQKPEGLIRDVLSWHPSDNVILDPFMGSGTVLKAAKDMGKQAIGIEIEERYCEIAAKRLEQEVLPLMTA